MRLSRCGPALIPTSQRIPSTWFSSSRKVHAERITIRGNSRTRKYVIRREFDIAEGDAYNTVLIDRAERRLKNLGYFKAVKITNEPGSAPDHIVVNVDVEDRRIQNFRYTVGMIDWK